NGINSNGDCTWTLQPANLTGPYTATLSDDNACANTQSFDIDIQQQPFSFSCATLSDTYCDNSTDVITLNDLIDPVPGLGILKWYINGALISTPTLSIYDFNPGLYALSFTFEHGDAPNCEFTDVCNFTITPLIQPNLNATLAFCQGENVEII